MNTIQFLSQLIAFPTVSRVSNVEITDYLQNMLTDWGGVCERIDFLDPEGVTKSNLIAKFGTGTGGLAYFCHTDVVPADNWNVSSTPFSSNELPSNPFTLQLLENRVYGRGSCDMKGSIACFLSALKHAIGNSLKFPVYFIATADEEVGYKGASQVVEHSNLYQEMVEHNTPGIIGEPTELQVVHAHKGVCGLKITSHGIAAHSSTNLGRNANLKMIPFLQEMKAIYDESITDPVWSNQEFSPPDISLNIGINDYTYARNITPGISICTLFFRPVPGFDIEALLARIRLSAESNHLDLSLESLAYPMYRDPRGDFVQQTLMLFNQSTSQTVSYGTDGAVYAGLKNLLVLGPGSIKQAHTDNEFIELEQLTLGENCYLKMIQSFCS